MKEIVCALVVVLTAPLPLAAEAVAPEVVTSQQNRMEYLPQVAYNSVRDEYLAVWHDYAAGSSPERRILARRLDRYGRSIAGPAILSFPNDTYDRSQVAVSYDPIHDRYLLAYVFDFFGDGSDYDVRALLLSWDMVPIGNELPLGYSGLNEWNPSIDFSTASGTFLVVWWHENPATYASVRGARVSAAGAAGSDFLIADHATQNRLDPDVAYQPFGDNFLVTYTSQADIFGKIVTAAGAVGSEIDIAAWPDPESAPAVASCKNYQYLVTWESQPSGGSKKIYSRFLYGDGTIWGAPILVANISLDSRRPDVTCIDGDIDYLVVYEQQYVNLLFGIRGNKLSATKELGPGFAIRDVFGGETTGVASRAAVAGGSTGWLAIWEHQRQGSSYMDIHDRAVWQLFSDGFEWSNTSTWSATVP